MITGPTIQDVIADVEHQRTELTPTHLRVLAMLADGLTLAAIARRLGRSEGAIKSQCRRMRSRLGAYDNGEAVARAYRRGLFGVFGQPGERAA